VAPLEEFGLASLALDLLPDLRVTRKEAMELLGRLQLIAQHTRALQADRMAETEDESPRPRRR